MSSTPHEQTTQVRRRKGSKHDKTGCLTCRHRRKKCVENVFPVCGTCARLNLKCIRQPTRDVVSGTLTEQRDAKQTETSSNQLETASSLPSLPLASIGLSLPTGESSCDDPLQKRHALRYYISVVTTHLTVSQQFNSFLTAFLPMAMESPALFDVLLALASGHLSLTDESHTVSALENRSTAIRNLAKAISTPSHELTRHETNAAACLGFVIYEAGVGDCRTWYTHLKGAHQIIVSTSAHSSGKLLEGPGAFKTSTEGQWILRNFAYHDVIGSITLRRRPLLNGDYLDGITDVVDSCVGVAVGLLSILARISCLDADTSFHSQTPIDDHEHEHLQHHFLTTCATLEQALLTWTCNPNAEPGLASLAYTYRNASLITLYRLLRNRLTTSYITSLDTNPSPPSQTPSTSPTPTPTTTTTAIETIQAKIQTQVSDTLTHLSNIPIGSEPESALLFPVFMIGGEARDEGQMDVVRTRLRHMAEKRQFRNLLQARWVLEDLWDLRRKTDAVEADWTQIQDAAGVDLLLT